MHDRRVPQSDGSWGEEEAVGSSQAAEGALMTSGGGGRTQIEGGLCTVPSSGQETRPAARPRRQKSHIHPFFAALLRRTARLSAFIITTFVLISVPLTMTCCSKCTPTEASSCDCSPESCAVRPFSLSGKLHDAAAAAAAGACALLCMFQSGLSKLLCS